VTLKFQCLPHCMHSAYFPWFSGFRARAIHYQRSEEIIAENREVAGRRWITGSALLSIAQMMSSRALRGDSGPTGQSQDAALPSYCGLGRKVAGVCVLRTRTDRSSTKSCGSYWIS
jgi:hypothetical protein